LTLELYPHFIPGPKPQGSADGAHAVLLVSKDTQAMIQRSMRYCGWKKGSGIAWGITFFPLMDSFLDFPFCPFFLAICSMLELEAAISTVCATFWSFEPLIFHGIYTILVLHRFMLHGILQPRLRVGLGVVWGGFGFWLFLQLFYGVHLGLV
jgi:hypothetical protein